MSRLLLLALAAALMVFNPLIAAANIAEVTRSLQNDIKKSQQRLNASEQRIAKQAAKRYRQLEAQQRKVEKLREQVAVARREADEQTLGLEQLQQRLKQWRDQNQFQKHLLVEFAEKTRANSQQQTAIMQSMQVGLTLVEERIGQQRQRLQSGWQPAELISAEAVIEQGEILTLGPVNWFWQPGQQRGGLAIEDAPGRYSVVQNFSGEALSQLQAVYDGGLGQLSFDPTLDRALKIAGTQETLWQHLQKGGLWVVPILCFALLSLIIAGLKALQLWRLPKLQPLLAERIESLAKGDNADGQLQQLRTELRGAEAELVTIAAETPVSQQRDERLFAYLLQQRHFLEKRLGAIAVAAAVSPLLGLLGTVSGMIETFKLITLFGAGDPAAVSGGISEALVTTEMGLVVAIPALLLHALLSRSVKGYNTGLEALAVKLGQLELPRGCQ